ncbi:MAG: DUF4392 domain-containing protein [Euryarchaeota archaeon]|nr:DUF4392 domain-containing protein [Euryarchaeota archaeon]
MYTAIDHQITLDLGDRNCRRLYEAAHEGTPLVKRAAEPLLEAADSRDRVLLSTGFPIVPPVAPETDGPLGTAVMAHALDSLGAEPVIVVEPMVEATMATLLDVLDCEAEIELVDPATASAESLLDRDEPGAVVAVEKPGRCADGSHRNMNGEAVSRHVSSVDALFEEARDRGVPTVAVGDGGNEIGMGVVQSAVRKHVDHGETIACVTSVDHLVVAGVSNWGAYGIVGALSLLAGEPLLHTAQTERRLLAASLKAGCVDGVSGESVLSVDGIPSGVHEGVVSVLAESCGAALDGS